MTDQELVQADIESLYLGNLGTVEFNLELPQTGKNGSSITWESSAPHFLAADGTVTRPSYGRGNRTVILTATFAHGSYTEQRDYEVQVLEEEADFTVTSHFPVALQARTGAVTYLPDAVAATTEDGRVLALRVAWDGGLEHTWDCAGTYTVQGVVRDTDYAITADVTVSDEGPENIVDPADELACVEAHLTPGSDFFDAQERMHTYLLSTDTDQQLYNFREAAGLDTRGAEPMTGWDSPDGLLRGHTTGHYLSALAKCWRATGDERILAKAREMVAGLVACQKGLESKGCAAGFLSAYDEEQFDLLEVYTPYPQIWAPYYTLHKILAGLLDLAELAGIEDALTLADGIGSWTRNRLTKLPHAQLVRMWNIYIAGEYGGMNEALARLARLTGKPEHAETARLFDNDRLFFPLLQNVDALNGMHANQHIPQIVGAMELFHATGDASYLTIAERFWDEITTHHVYAIGGTGESEMWHAADEVCNLLTASTCESCASYNMLKLTGMLHTHKPDAYLMDYYERTLFSHTLATCDHEPTGGTTYFISMTPGAQKDINCAENSCCHGTGMEQPSMYADHIYHVGRTDSGSQKLYVDLFISSTAAVEANGLSIEQVVDGKLPGKTSLRVASDEGVELMVRKPTWCAGKPICLVDDAACAEACREDAGYLVIDLATGSHDVEIEFPVALRVEHAADDETRYTVFWGPYVLAALVDDASEEPLAIPAAEAVALEPAADGSMAFTHSATGTRFIPFEQVHHEHYHIYLRNA